MRFGQNVNLVLISTYSTSIPQSDYTVFMPRCLFCTHNTGGLNDVTPLPHKTRCLRLLLVCRPIVCVHVCVWEAPMGPQWVALHKNISDEERLDGELRGQREGAVLPLAPHNVSLSVSVSQHTHTHTHGLSPEHSGV